MSAFGGKADIDSDVSEAIRSARFQEIVQLVDPALRWRILWRGRRDWSLEGLASPKNRAASAILHCDDHARPEITGRGGLPQHPSTAGRPFGHSAALEGVVGAGPNHLEHSRIPTRSHRRNASSRFCWCRRSTDQHASQTYKRAARTRSRIQLPARICALDTAPAVFGMWLANCYYDCYQAAT